jgi:TonB family protein
MKRRTACSLIALGVADAVLGQDAPWEAPTRTGLAALEQGFREDAERDLSLALSQAKSATADDLVVARCLDNLALATVLKDRKRETLYRQSLAIREQRLRPDDPQIATSLAHVASTAYRVGQKPGDLDEAEQMLKRALGIAEANPKSELMAEVLETLGLLRHYGCAGRNDYAELPDTVEPLYRRALEIREATSREDDVALARILELNSVLLRETGRSDQANALAARSGGIRSRHFQKLSPVDYRGPYREEGPPPGAYRIGGGVSSPSILAKVEPEYSDLARLLKWQGTVALSLVVTEAGATDSFRLARSLGLGLDEQAFFAVRTWKFRPGQKEGKPVRVIATVEVNFRLL